MNIVGKSLSPNDLAKYIMPPLKNTKYAIPYKAQTLKDVVVFTPTEIDPNIDLLSVNNVEYLLGPIPKTGFHNMPFVFCIIEYSLVALDILLFDALFILSNNK